jgi:hypothetical protein
MGLPEAEREAIAAGRSIIADLVLLRDDVKKNHTLSPLPCAEDSQIREYNAELKARGASTWHDVEWLFSDSYLYTRVAPLFRRNGTEFWTDYDPFHRQKLSTFKLSQPATIELAKRYRDIIT